VEMPFAYSQCQSHNPLAAVVGVPIHSPGAHGSTALPRAGGYPHFTPELNRGMGERGGMVE
jgi:hypothetical protein